MKREPSGILPPGGARVAGKVPEYSVSRYRPRESALQGRLEKPLSDAAAEIVVRGPIRARDPFKLRSEVPPGRELRDGAGLYPRPKAVAAPPETFRPSEVR